ncbi:Pirin [Colletotrichum shisoi]|uniref:Pirin n=1 Tax=Colletotrichum shisoi TaxID=2078593 RepID=A0A5Q4BYB8_9PEZI|nr:Pirin [Colletotrichum shisoi]
MCEPRYRDLHANEIPHARLDDGRVNIKVISGKAGGVDSVKGLAYTPVWYLDVEIKPGGSVTQPLPQGWNAFAYVFEGAAGGRSSADTFDAVIFEREGDVVDIEVPASAGGGARLVLIAGQVLDQPIALAQHGLFVMTSREEVQQAVEDFYMHKNGFERAKGWRSERSKKKGMY